QSRDDFLNIFNAAESSPITVYNDLDNEMSPKLPSKFRLLTQYVLSRDIPPPDQGFIYGCECQGGKCLDPRQCQCTEFDDSSATSKREFVYQPDGRLKYIGIVYECNSECPCGPDCGNRVVQRGRTVELQIFKTKKKGWGLRSPQFLGAGQFICCYYGEIITSDEAAMRAHIMSDIQRNPSNYLFNMDLFTKDSETADYHVIDARRQGGVARFINHSCEPNLSIVGVCQNRTQTLYNLAFFAKYDIQPNQELTIDYGRDYIGSRIGLDLCACGSPKCRKKGNLHAQ
ncbi:uncharacterized protein V1516DRAFT_621082, partial [Lipomyces oligophaga]|uniref:uncharacterized protein n=1 Tax=Lipomyces oligophaga TaxID=45792 RepID=UPI0034CF3555